jgi:hypothetical protein
MGDRWEPSVGYRESGEVDSSMRLEMLAALSMDSVCGANHRIRTCASVSCMFQLTNYQSFLYIPNDKGIPSVCTARISALDTLPFSPPGSPLSVPQFSHLPPITHHPRTLQYPQSPHLSATRKQIAGTQVAGKKLVVSLRIKTLACLIDSLFKKTNICGKRRGGGVY